MNKVLENRLERIKLAIEKGYTANTETGEVFGVKGGVISSKTNGYISAPYNHNGKLVRLKAHQFIWYLANGSIVNCIDHINGDKTDNRISNLRSVTQQENAFNTIAKGYYWSKILNKWYAKIKVDGKSIHLGYFINEDDARKAYLDAKIKYHTIKT